jgi:uncharacterized protein (DUF983 family)
MKRDPRTILLTLGRCLKLQCPACGNASAFARPFHVNDRCTACRVIFKREEGFFVGAIMANVVATEAVILLAYFVCLLLISNEQTMLTILFIVGATFPLLFYHHSWTLWLGMDHLIEGLPQKDSRQ